MIANVEGQIISKYFFGVFNFLQKTNENKSNWGIIVVKSNSFVRFLEKIEDIKTPFEIYLPLAGLTDKLYKTITLCFCVFCTLWKSLFHIGRKLVRTQTRGKLHHTQTPALDHSATWTKLEHFFIHVHFHKKLKLLPFHYSCRKNTS